MWLGRDTTYPYQSCPREDSRRLVCPVQHGQASRATVSVVAHDARAAMTLQIARSGHTQAREPKFPVVAAVAAIAALATGSAIAFSPEMAAAGLAFILLLALSQSREATVAFWLSMRILMFSGYIPGPIGESALL